MIYKYTDYRKFIYDFKKKKGIKWKDFAEASTGEGCDTLDLYNIVNNTSILDSDEIWPLAQVMGLWGNEILYLRLMVLFADSESKEEKIWARQSMKEHKGKQ